MRLYKTRFLLISLVSSVFFAPAAVSEQLTQKNTPPSQIDKPYVWVMLGENGQPIVRLITRASSCPLLMVNGKKTPLTLRAAPEMMSEQPTPALFPERVCEKLLPSGVKSVVFNGKQLPLPSSMPKRIVILGDTGCRLDQPNVQACNDPHAFPYGKIAQRAALWKPDLIVHLGDYHSRETPCPHGVPGCQNSPWGYGYDTWKADFFDPSRPLLTTAPWVFVRGNHETCGRAGHGWRRYLSITPFSHEKACINRTPESTPDIEDSYRIPLGDGAQFIVWDSSYESDGPIPPDDPRFARYRAIYGQLADLAQRAPYSIALSHYPLLGMRPKPANPTQPFTGALGIQSVFRTLNPYLLPQSIHMLMGGHINLWEQINFIGSSWPSQFIIGNSGVTLQDRVFPDQLSSDMTPYAPAKIESFSTVEQEHGFTTLERLGPQKWRVQAHTVDGLVRRTCIVKGRHSSCR
jgi:hypothetical protein